MTKKQEEFLRKALNRFATECIITHAKGFDRKELTVEEFETESENSTQKMLNSIRLVMEDII